MATIATTVSTLADVAKRTDPSGVISDIIEMLSKYNPILDHMLVVECNDGSGHKTTVRTGIPQAAWRLLNYGVPRGKSQTAAVRDTTGMLETYAECDKDLANLSGNAKAYRLSEAEAFLQGMSQQVADTIFYGNTRVNPERFLGLAARYATGVVADAASAANVINAGGADPTSNTSLWLLTWNERSLVGLYPKGSRAGFQHNDLGEQTIHDDNNNMYQGYRDHFKWDIGLSLRDWRSCGRIANIDTDQLEDVTYLKALVKHMITLSEMMPVAGEQNKYGGDTTPTTRRYWYCNKKVRTALRFAILEKIATNLTWETVEGKRVAMFDDIPVERIDALLNTEPVVPFA